MKNYRMLIEYDGTKYHGWERKTNVDTIQGKLEGVLEAMTGSEVKVIGAGRTDAGVHAKGMVANVHLDIEMSEDELRDYMNRYLPEDICIREIKLVSDRFHSRYNAVGKTYQYTCYVGKTKPVFNRRYVNMISESIDIDAIKRAANFLVGEHDFMSFCGNPKIKKSTVRQIYSIQVEVRDDILSLTYHGSGFLQYMVRILSGTLLEIGLGKRTVESISELLELRDRSKAGFTAPAKGLCLIKVDYQ